MQFPESWLREFCNPPIDTDALANVLTMAGLEVEAMRPAAPAFSGVVVGRVLSVVPHPNADRLRVCSVDVGGTSPLGIVCGAANVAEGIKVPCAVVGASLPPGDDGKPFEIRASALRGVESQGMLCSARELKLSDDHAGLMLLDADAPVGIDLRSHLDLDDTLFTLKLTPNLAHDLSILGVARELSALTGAPLKERAVNPVPVTNSDLLAVIVDAAELCGRFSGRIIRHVNPAARTPAWMVERLARCGQRSVSPLVDISNYVMFESGQPSHMFDLARIHAPLEVRWARAGESLELLNGSTVELAPDVGVIADQHAVESLAGIMGGAATAISDDTTDVYLEAAFWWPTAVAGRARRYHFTTEAGHRFERGVDPKQTVARIERISELVREICSTRETSFGPIDDRIVNLPTAKAVTLRVDRATKVIGMPVTQSQCEDILDRLGFSLRSKPGVIEATPPSWRFDVTIEEDLIEEVIRLIGYEALPGGPPQGTAVPRVTPTAVRSAATVRRQIAALGYQETIGFSFVAESLENELAINPDPIRVLNPIVSTQAVMRSTLLGSLVQALRFNVARKASRFRAFEIGKVFVRDASAIDGDRAVAGVRQPLRVAGLAYGPVDPLQWGSRERSVDFFDVKGDVEALLAPADVRFVASTHPAFHPGRTASVMVDGRSIGVVGELHPRWRQAYELSASAIAFELDGEAVLARAPLAYEKPPKRQSSFRDLALIVGAGVAYQDLVDTVLAEPSGYVRSVRLFDIYKPELPAGDMHEGERSYALRIELLDADSALTDVVIEEAIERVLSALASRDGVRLRH